MALEDPAPVPIALEVEENEMVEEEEEDEEEEYGSWSSESEVGDALDWLDSKKGVGEGISGASFSFSVALRPNAHGGLLSRLFQPLSNLSHKFASHIRADPLEEWEGRLDVGLSNSVTTAIRDSVRELAIGRTKNTDKADRASPKKKLTGPLLNKLTSHIFPLHQRRRVSKYILQLLLLLPLWAGITYQELLKATESFSEIVVIGSGACGTVHKAVMLDGSVIAVKKLKKLKPHGEGSNIDSSFWAEISTLGNIRHRNIVKLYSFCYHQESNLILYEYMANGSLGELLHRNRETCFLDWNTPSTLPWELLKVCAIYIVTTGLK